MKRLVRLLLLGLLSPLSMATATLAQDSRLVPLTSRAMQIGWEAVGRLEIEKSSTLQGLCTGTLIRADLVLTAAHCVTNGGSALAPSQIVFKAGYLNGGALATSRVAQVAVDKAWTGGETLDTTQVRHDVALLLLADPIPSDIAEPFAVDLPDEGSEVSLMSYGAGREEYLSWQKRCQTAENQDGISFFSCEVEHGSSGAPVFDRSRGRSRIVAIISGQATVDDQPYSVGMQLPERVAELKTQLRVDQGLTVGQGARKISVGDRSGGGAKFVKP